MVEMADLKCINDVQATLSAAVQSNDIQSFKMALKIGADASSSDGKMSIFELACRTPERGEFIKECLQQQNSDVLHKNPKSSKYPIHYVIESMDTENLQALLTHRPSEQINLEYQKRTPLLLLTEQMKAENVDQCYECIKLLVKFKANFNLPDENDFTPILNILKAEISDEKRQEIVRFCFANAKIDVDSFRGGMARKQIENKLPGFVIPKYEAPINFKALESFLNNDNLNSKRFEVSFKNYLDEIKNDARWSTFIKEEFVPLLALSIEKENEKCFNLVLSQNEDLQSISNGKISELLLKTCKYGQSNMLMNLLDIIKSNREIINKNPLLCEVIRNVESIEKENGEYKCKYFTCFNILMDNSNIDVDKVDQIKCPPIYYAIKYKWNEIIQKLLAAGAYIGTQTMFNKLAILEIDPEILEKYLDSCIKTNEKRLGDDDYSIILNFACLIPPKYKENCESVKGNAGNDEEILPVVHISQSNELKHLLKHPVIWSFIFLKWLQLSIFFYINLVLCSIFFLAILVNLTTFYGVEDVESGFWWTMQLLGGLYLLIREFLQFLMSPLKHFKSFMNIVELILIILVFATLHEGYSNTTKGIISSITILLIGYEYIFLIGSLPFMTISTHTAMLRTVSTSFLHSLLLYSIGLISFALAFFLLYRFKPKNGKDSDEKEDDDSEFNSFTNPFISILKTFVMLTGEFEAADIEVDFSIAMCVIFGLFVFFVPIVISNLINGLAVNDTQIIKSQAELVGLQQRVELLEKYQQSVWLQQLTQKLFGCCYRSSANDLATKEISIFPNRSNNFTRTTVKPINKTMNEVEINLIDEDVSCYFCQSCSPMDAKVVKYAREKINNQTQGATSYEELKKQLDKIMELLINYRI